MLPKSFAGLSLAVVACAGLAGTVSASTIYQDTFTGSSAAGTLNGSAPNLVDTPNKTWTAASVWSDSGYSNSGTNARYTATLPFTPVAGEIYTLTAGLDVTKATDPSDIGIGDYWFTLGFASNQSTTAGWDSAAGGAGPWVLSGWVPSSSGNYAGYTGSTNGGAFPGPALTDGVGFGNDITPGVNNYKIILNTTSSLWTYQEYLTNSTYTNKLLNSSASNPFSSNPAITAVGFQNGKGAGYVTDFTLTAVPEPATLGLMGIGAAGLLLVGRKRRVA